MAALFALAPGVGESALAATLPQQAGESGEQLASERLPVGAISRAHSFVVAYGGQSYFFNYEAGAVNVPFLSDVYKPFGFSHDSRLFLYLKSQGRFPAFTLYAYDVTTGAETAVSGSRQVHNAAWSPTALDAAYVWLDTNGEFHLSLVDLATTKTKDIAHGRIEPDYLEWSPAGDRLIYSTIVPQTTNFIHDRQFSSTLHVYNVQNGRSSEIKDAVTARFRGNDLLVVSSTPTKQYTTIENPQQEDIRDLAVVGDEIYTTIIEGNQPVTKHWNSQTRSFEKIEEGQIYRTTDAGVVVRNFGAGSVDYKYVTPSSSPTQATSFRAIRKAATTSSTASAAPSWEMPFQGSAYLVQGGTLYSGGACDGRACIITSHSGVLGYALDWQQVPTDGQGNTHILAIADGTVVGTQNSVSCNSNTGNQFTCPDYSSTCNDPSGGLGNYVSIAHSDGSYSFYGHLKYQSVQVTANQTVTQGTYIADQGHSGVAGTYNNYLGCGDHLHFQRQVSAAPWAQSIATDFTELPCVLTCTSAYVSANVENTPLSSSSLTVLLAPTTIVGVANSAANQVVLPSPAPAGGAVVSLSSSAPSLASVPASVTVPAGAVSAPFSISVIGVLSATSATIWASYGGNTANAVLTLQPVTISYLVLQASSVTGGATVNNNEVDLIGTAPANFAVTLSSSAAAATVPSSISVPAGANSATFPINTSPVSAAVTSTIGATDGVNSFNRSLTINPAFLSSVTLPSSTVGGNTVTGTVVLTGTTAQNFVVGLASSDPSVTVPSSVTVLAGNSTANFSVNTSVVSSPLQVTITATGPGGGTASAQMTVNPPAGPFTPIRVNAGASSGYTDPLSQVWSADTGYSGYGGMITSSGTVYGTNVPAIYQTGHWGYASSSQPLWYTFSVPNGTYTVNLKFDDPAFTQPGQRLFNVYINGQQVLPNFDIIAQAGGPYRAVDIPFTVNVTNGTIQIQFVAVLQNARICGIEIVGGTPAAPTLSSMTPATISAGSSALVTFTGTNLANDVVVNAPAGINVTNVKVVSSTQVTATVAVVSGEPSGAYNLSATTVGGRSNPLAVTVGSAAGQPTLSSINPASGVAGTNVPVTLTGTNFSSGTTVNAPTGITVSGVNVISSTQLTATFAISSSTAAGNYNISVTNSGGTSNTSTFSVTPAAPTVGGISPNTASAGSSIGVTLTGTNFVSGATINTPSGITASAVTVVSSTQITATFAVASSITPSAYNISVTTSGGTSNSVSFSVSPPIPTISSISPNSGTAGTSVAVTLTGSNFASGATVNTPAGITASNVSVVSGTQITATFTVATNATPGGYSVTVSTANGTSNAVTFTVVNSAAFTPIRVNAGATSGYTDPLSQLWSADTGYSGSGGMITSSGTVYGTNVPAIYQTGHWGYASSSQPLWYTFSVPNGTYTVNLKFDDPAFTQPGQRTFNVFINGQQVLSNFDMIAQAGGPFRAIDTPFTVNVTNGTIQIQFVAVLQNARICGIEIVAGTPAAPTLSSISPATISAGSSAAVTFTGTNLGTDVVVNAPAGINVSNVTVVNSTQVTATVAVVSGEPSGTYNLSVTTLGGTSNAVSLTTK